jgi:hypothetical protein
MYLKNVSPSLHREHERSKVNGDELGLQRSGAQHIAPPRRDPHHIFPKQLQNFDTMRKRTRICEAATTTST